jgi:hypothetical protein
MIETLYAQLISDDNTRKIFCETDNNDITTDTIIRDDCTITIKHKLDDFMSCLIVKR